MSFNSLTLLLFLLSVSYLFASQEDFNPYEVLGLSRTATEKEIRQAYKKLAKHWHPDKNSEPNAHEQFTKVNAAYEILSDSTKRQNYDEYGTTSQENHRGFNTNHFRDPFDMFRAHFFQEAPAGAKKIIHTYEFLKNILPNSDRKPYVIFGSTNFCFHCRQPLAVFRSMEKQLNDVGIGTGEFNINDQHLSSELGVSSSPSLCVISQGRVYHFQNQEFSETNIKEFVRKSIPIQRLVKTLSTVEEISDLIKSSSQTNRVHAILFTKQKHPTLKFLLPCLQYANRIQCALFNSTVLNSQSIPVFLQEISLVSDTILLFKEDPTRPDLVIKNNDFSFTFIQKTFESNQLLHLPSITSAHVFNLICPKNSAKPCFLIIGDSHLFSHHHSALLQLSIHLQFPLSYLDSSTTKQSAFHRILSHYYQANEKKLLILAARRWLDDNIEIQNTHIEFDEKTLEDLPANQIHIEENLQLFLSNRWQNAKKHPLPFIIDFDQRTENVFTQLIDLIGLKWNVHIERNRFLRYFSTYLYTYQFWMITVFVILYLYYSRQEPTRPPPRSNTQVKLYEFNQAFFERYADSAAPNVIIILLLAETSRDACVKRFRKEIDALRPHSRLIFSICSREKAATWLEQLAEQSSRTLPSSTILALYPRRKFFVSLPFEESSSSTLTFSDWIDLLSEGNFREPVQIADWPRSFV